MEAIEMVALFMLAILIGFVLSGILIRRNASYWRNEADEWRRQVDDERTRR